MSGLPFRKTKRVANGAATTKSMRSTFFHGELDDFSFAAVWDPLTLESKEPHFLQTSSLDQFTSPQSGHLMLCMVLFRPVGVSIKAWAVRN